MKYLTYNFLPIIPVSIFLPLLQIPTEVPKPQNNSPIDLNNTADIIIYIVLPIVVLFLFVIVRRFRKKK